MRQTNVQWAVSQNIDLRLILYAGIALIVGSLALMVRDQPTLEYQMALAFGAPVLFYIVGGLALRYLNAPLAAPGIVATGAWLLVVAMLYSTTLYDNINANRGLWWLISLVVTAIITITGHRVKFALLYPLVLIVQINAVGAVASALGIEWQWLTSLSFIMVAVWWWGVPRLVRDATWITAYRVGAALLIGLLVTLSLFLRENAFVSPISTSLTLVLGGAATLWIGGRRSLIAAHGGVWLIAGGWITFYLDWLGDTGAFGLWLALLAASALLIERVLSTFRDGKKKGEATVFEVVTRWALADLSLGLSVIILLWTARNIDAASPLIVLITLLVTCGVWIVGGLVYRLPALLHAALWVLPLPVALLFTYLAPWYWSLALMGVEWQLLAVGFIVIGHMMARRRPSIRLPFFASGYFYLGFGLTLTLNSPQAWLPISLGVMTLVMLITAGLVLAERHRTWDWLIDRVIRQKSYPIMHQSARNIFLLIGSWFAAIWLVIMLPLTGLDTAQQGMMLVLLSAAWFVIGRTLMTTPRFSGWMVYSAGWMLWLMGLLLVFFSPVQAILTMIVGLIMCGEAVWRTRAAYWMPIVILQIGFVIVQAAYLLMLDANLILLTLMIAIALGSMVLEQHGNKRLARFGKLAVMTGTGIACLTWLTYIRPESTLLVTILAAVALLRYRHWSLIVVLNVLVMAMLAMMNPHTYVWYGAFVMLAGVNSVLAWWVKGIRAWYTPITFAIGAAVAFGVQFPALWEIYVYGFILAFLVGLWRAGLLIPLLIIVAAVIAGMVLSKMMMMIAAINVWLIPLTVGVSLMGAAIWMERRRGKSKLDPPTPLG